MYVFREPFFPNLKMPLTLIGSLFAAYLAFIVAIGAGVRPEASFIVAIMGWVLYAALSGLFTLGLIFGIAAYEYFTGNLGDLGYALAGYSALTFILTQFRPVVSAESLRTRDLASEWNRRGADRDADSYQDSDLGEDADSERVGDYEYMMGLEAKRAGIPVLGDNADVWFERAAAQGNTRAMLRLGCMYADGEGVAEDIVQAYLWFEFAEVLNNPYGEILDEAKDYRKSCADRMSPNQIAEAHSLGIEFAKKYMKQWMSPELLEESERVARDWMKEDKAR